MGLMGASLLVAPLASSAFETTTCSKVKGQVTCVTATGPGQNQGGVGETTAVETQGNTTNTSPAPQDLTTTSVCAPTPTSKHCK